MTPRPERREHHWALGFVVRVVIAFALIAVMTHTLVRPFAVPSGSMEPTLRTGDRVAVRILGVDGHALERGQVIAFAHGASWEAERIDEPHPVKDLLRTGGDVVGIGPSHHAHTVKRIIGLPGEKVSCCDDQGRALVDGEPLPEPYNVRAEDPQFPTDPATMPGASENNLQWLDDRQDDWDWDQEVMDLPGVTRLPNRAENPDMYQVTDRGHSYYTGPGDSLTPDLDHAIEQARNYEDPSQDREVRTVRLSPSELRNTSGDLNDWEPMAPRYGPPHRNTYPVRGTGLGEASPDVGEQLRLPI